MNIVSKSQASPHVHVPDPNDGQESLPEAGPSRQRGPSSTLQQQTPPRSYRNSPPPHFPTESDSKGKKRLSDVEMDENAASKRVRDMPRVPPGTLLAAYDPKLDSVRTISVFMVYAKQAQIPIARLQAMIIKNQDEKLALLEQKEEIEDQADDLMGDDPEMIAMKMWFSPSPFRFRR